MTDFLFFWVNYTFNKQYLIDIVTNLKLNINKELNIRQNLWQ